MIKSRYVYVLACMTFIALSCQQATQQEEQIEEKQDPKKLLVSENGRFLTTGDGKPFFWLGDTGWLLGSRLTREEATQYLEDRKQRGFNVIQMMLLHTVPSTNIYSDSSILHKKVSQPAITEGSDFKDSLQYDYWDHIDFIIEEAAKRGLYMGLVPVWGTPVKAKNVNATDAKIYAKFLADRYKDKWNIIWLNGGDERGDVQSEVWLAIGETLRANDPNHLITFHPRGRTKSSQWFHNSAWSDFNMIQSGHRRYNQDTTQKEKWHYGEDNWKYIEDDYQLKSVKPTIDGEPSYEEIPQGLHNPKEIRWNAADVRRYGYWSVFAGAFGYTYGHNSVMQMYKLTDKAPSYGPRKPWDQSLNAEGATQMKYLKDLILSKSYFDRVPDQTIIAKNGEKYDHLQATRGENWAMVYTYNGKDFLLNMGKIPGEHVKASWFDPRSGKSTLVGAITNKGTHKFNPPGEPKDGNDWVLVLDKL